MLYHSTTQYNNTPYCVNLNSSVVLPLGPRTYKTPLHTWQYDIGNGSCNLTHLVHTENPQSYYDNKVHWDGKVFSV
jgi:hypothetical protein